MTLLDEEERKKHEIQQLPYSLQEAIKEFESSEFLQNVLGQYVSKRYIEAKKEEWKDYMMQVTDWHKSCMKSMTFCYCSDCQFKCHNIIGCF